MDGVIARGKDVRKMQMLWIGLLVYNIGYMYSELVDFPSALIIRLFFYAGLLLFMYPVLISIVDIFTTLNRAGRYLKIVMWLTIGWSFVSLLHVGGDGEFSVGKVVTPYLLLPYMAIVLVLMSSENLLRSFFSIGGKMGYLFFLISVIPLSSTVSFGFIQMLLENFAVFGALIFLTNKYQSARNAAFAAVVVLGAVLIAAILGRRNLMLTFGLYFMFGFIGSVVNGKFKTMESKIIIVLLCLLLGAGSYYYYKQESYGTFSTITSRAGENTREDVMLDFLLDMGNPKDLLIGRGFYGTYYCPNVDKDSDTGESDDNREVIENGYLQIILKGGIIYLLLYMMLMIPAIVKGVKAPNQLSKACAVIVFVQLVDMLVFGVPTFNIKTFMIWMAVSVCYNKRIAGMTDDEVNEMLFVKKRKLMPWEKK